MFLFWNSGLIVKSPIFSRIQLLKWKPSRFSCKITQAWKKQGHLLVLTTTSWASSTTKEKLKSNASAWVNEGFPLFNFFFCCQNSVLENVSNFPSVLFCSFSTEAFKQHNVLENLVLSPICPCSMFLFSMSGAALWGLRISSWKGLRFPLQSWVQHTPWKQFAIQLCLPDSCLCLSPAMVPEQFSLLCGLTRQCAGGKCSCSFSWEGCMFRLLDPLWFSVSQTSARVAFIESGVFFLRRK